MKDDRVKKSSGSPDNAVNRKFIAISLNESLGNQDPWPTLMEF
jgi:hypothetical protein